MLSSKSKGVSAAPASGYNKFRLHRESDTIRRRARFDPTSREKVKAVRRNRACLRCSLLRVPVRVVSPQPLWINSNLTSALMMISVPPAIISLCIATRNRHYRSQGASGLSSLKSVSLKHVGFSYRCKFREACTKIRRPSSTRHSALGPRGEQRPRTTKGIPWLCLSRRVGPYSTCQWYCRLAQQLRGC